MRTIVLKYGGTCRKCGAELASGIEAAYEKWAGIFCLGCAPSNPEEIRAYRQGAADQKANNYEKWAAKRKAQAHATLAHNETYTGDIAFNTQPGHFPLRARVIAQNDKAYESLRIAQRMERKAESLRVVRMAGDAEKARQAKREASDSVIQKGTRVRDPIFGDGEVVGVFKKSYRIRFDGGYTYARDKSYVEPIAPAKRGE